MCDFNKLSPCNNCPYRTDAPLRLWHISEFEKLKESEGDTIGKVYLCHKKDGHVCVGWLMKQIEKDYPSIALRIQLSKQGVTKEYLDRIHCKVPLYQTVDDMIEANFPELKLFTYNLPITIVNKKNETFNIRYPQPTGGKAGKGYNVTSSIQIWYRENFVIKQIRYKVDDNESKKQAIMKAIRYCMGNTYLSMYYQILNK